jgi:hypothetical protein
MSGTTESSDKMSEAMTAAHVKAWFLAALADVPDDAFGSMSVDRRANSVWDAPGMIQYEATFSAEWEGPLK